MIIKRIIIATSIFGFCIVWSWFAACGIVQLYEKPRQAEILEAWKDRTIDLELKVEDYERITKALPILRQLITPMGWLEIEALAESDRQKKQKGAK